MERGRGEVPGDGDQEPVLNVGEVGEGAEGDGGADEEGEEEEGVREAG